MRSSYHSLSFKMLPILLLLLPLATLGQQNDWSKPCFQGECFYDLLPTNTQASGSLKIVRILPTHNDHDHAFIAHQQWGSPKAISDITEAAGWVILGCDAKSMVQDIRLVCVHEDNCAHLYDGTGPVNKIVRLPENVSSIQPALRFRSSPETCSAAGTRSRVWLITRYLRISISLHMWRRVSPSPDGALRTLQKSRLCLLTLISPRPLVSHSALISTLATL